MHKCRGCASRLLDLRTLREVACPDVAFVFTERKHVAAEHWVRLVALVVEMVTLDRIQEVARS